MNLLVRLQRFEIHSYLATRLDQFATLADEDLFTIDQDRKLGKRSIDVRVPFRKLLKVSNDFSRRGTGGGELQEVPGDGNLLEIEIRQLMDLTDGNKKPPTVPIANLRD